MTDWLEEEEDIWRDAELEAEVEHLRDLAVGLEERLDLAEKDADLLAGRIELGGPLSFTAALTMESHEWAVEHRLPKVSTPSDGL